MLGDKRILAVVPARSGSKGIPDKNMRQICGTSLIGLAGQTLVQLGFIDARVISTDSPRYADEGRKYGLDAPFLRPPRLSSDSSGAVETAQHALLESEKHYGKRFDIVLIVEPTSPLRTPQDVEGVTRLLVDSGADSVVAVSPLSSKSHPRKLLVVSSGRLGFYLEGGNEVLGRQQLAGGLYWRNGICYALTRECLMGRQVIFTENTLPYIIDHEVVNIDEPIELEWAEFLLSRRKK